ncbi:MAG: LysR family transcriptional regulator, partial [Pseudomonadota bacterium]
PVAAAEPAAKYGWDLNADKTPTIPYLAYEQSSFLGMVVDSIIGHKRLNVETIYVDGLVETIKRRLMNGSGFAWMPHSAVGSELSTGALVPIGDTGWQTRLTIAALANPATFSAQSRQLWELL